MKKINCAVIGCGRIGCGFDDCSKIVRTHAGAYFRNPQTQLIALCDIDKKKLKKYGKKYQISKLYTSSNELFKNEKLDCVSICTLIDTHLELVKSAVKNGVKGIFLEKPIASNLKDAMEIIRICKNNDVTLVIDHQRRFHPVYEKIKKILEKKEIGKIQFVNVYYGAGIANTGSHLFDLLRMLFGEIKSIKGEFSNIKSSNYLDPNLDIILELNDFKCKIHSLDYKNYAVFQAEVFGTKGVIKLEMINNSVELLKTTSKNSPVYHVLKHSKINIKNIKFSPIELGLRHLLSCIKSKKIPKSNAYDGYKSLEAIVGALMSANKEKTIKFPLKNSTYQVKSR